MGIDTHGDFMPRLTGKVFTDLAIWMIAFGLLVGVIFPPFCIALGLPVERILTPVFFTSTLGAGVAVGAANFALAGSSSVDGSGASPRAWRRSRRSSRPPP